jgi:hypothetical protein
MLAEPDGIVGEPRLGEPAEVENDFDERLEVGVSLESRTDCRGQDREQQVDVVRALRLP